MAVKREVLARDGGRCAWTSPDGKRCGSTWKLELGHITPLALGGRSRDPDPDPEPDPATARPTGAGRARC